MSAFNSQQLNQDSATPSSSGVIPKSGTYKRANPANSNIHRLHQGSDSDDEDQNTYNGNSTQQM